MNDGTVQVYYGEGRGKTTAAYGTALRAANDGKTVYIIQFLKDKDIIENNIFKRLEPEIKFFRFEKNEKNYDSLSDEEKQEECINMRNGFHYARKVLVTGECNVLILDEFLGVLDNGVISTQEFSEFLNAKPEDATVVLTGRVCTDEIRAFADEIYNIEEEKLWKSNKENAHADI